MVTFPKDPIDLDFKTLLVFAPDVWKIMESIKNGRGDMKIALNNLQKVNLEIHYENINFLKKHFGITTTDAVDSLVVCNYDIRKSFDHIHDNMKNKT